MANNNTAAIAFMVIAALVVGILGSHAVWTKEVTVEKPVEKIKEVIKEVEVPVYINQTVETENSGNSLDLNVYLDDAKDAVEDEIGDESSFLTCGNHEYNEDEVEVSKVYEWGYLWLDDNDNKYVVAFKAKYVFNDDSDERDCKETRIYSVEFEDDEDPKVTELENLNL